MKTKNIQLVGRISGDDDYAVKFAITERRIYDAYRATTILNVINPVTICNYNWSWYRCVAKCLWSLIFRAHAVAVLPDFKESRGAKIELAVAILLGKKIIWL
ncbi:MAG: DUF4406 domain-containing protein [Bacteroidales bacterium]|jgi:hypothetical protein|nr:DUF4406 domain-containing protein [Bacteroidales bacterium]